MGPERSGGESMMDSMIAYSDVEKCNSWTWMFLYQEAGYRVGR